jgi:hypothetical protein
LVLGTEAYKTMPNYGFSLENENSVDREPKVTLGDWRLEVVDESESVSRCWASSIRILIRLIKQFNLIVDDCGGSCVTAAF